jgi:aspartate ammonia-lyase
MSISELINLIASALAAQNTAMTNAVKKGDLVEITRLTPLIAETEQTLAQLKTL